MTSAFSWVERARAEPVLPERTIQELEALELSRLVLEPQLGRQSVLGLGGGAAALAEPSGQDELVRLVRWCRKRKLPLQPVGSLTHVVVPDSGIRGVAVRLGEAWRKIEVVAENGSVLASALDDGRLAAAETRFEILDELLSEPPLALLPTPTWRWADGGVRLRVGAAVSSAALLQAALRGGLAGFHGLAAVPGTIGGALVMGAGTKGAPLLGRLVAVELLKGQSTSRVLAADLKRSGTGLVLPRGQMILRAEFRCSAVSPERVRKRAEELGERRRASQPAGPGVPGCLFSHPSGKQLVGEMVEELGLRGVRVRGVRLSERHGNYLVHEGGGSARDVMALMDYVRRKLKTVYGVTVHPRIKTL